MYMMGKRKAFLLLLRLFFSWNNPVKTKRTDKLNDTARKRWWQLGDTRSLKTTEESMSTRKSYKGINGRKVGAEKLLRLPESYGK